MRISHIGSIDEPPLVVGPIPQWGARQVAFKEGGSTQLAVLPQPVLVGSLLIGVGFYLRSSAQNLGPVVWSELTAHPWNEIVSRNSFEGSSQFERGIIVYGLLATATNQQQIRLSTGFDCVEIPPDQIGTDCDVVSAMIVELVPPGFVDDPVTLATVPVSGDNGPTANGLVVSSDADMVVGAPFFDAFLYIGACGWRIPPGTGGYPMAGVSWSPNQLNGGGIVNRKGIHGVSISWGAYAGNETFTPTATFASGRNTGLSMAAIAVEYGY